MRNLKAALLRAGLLVVLVAGLLIFIPLPWHIAAPPQGTLPTTPQTPTPATQARGRVAGATVGRRLPVRLQIPAIAIDAPVEYVGETPEGAMDVPKAWGDVAWFDQGYAPGELGSAVIAGHLDSTTDKAVFWDLRLLKPGDDVYLDENDGSRLTFQVLASQIYRYDQAPVDRIFGPSKAPLLNLVTCNGVFDRGSRNYDKRLVVYTQQLAR